MPRSVFPRDRFDDIAESSRVGAHRAENPHMRAWVVLLWALLATVVLIVAGIFATLFASGRISVEPTPTPTPVPTVEVAPIVDTSYQVMILNATPEHGLATQTKDDVVAAGWAEDSVLASEAGTQDFAETTVYYLLPGDEAAAKGLAGVVGGARTEQSDAYQPVDASSKQLTVVLGLDSTEAGVPQTPTPTP